MFWQKFKACLRFLGILLLRFFLGIVVAYLWAYTVAYVFHIVMDVWMPRDVIDHFYDTGPPREGRYGGTAGSVYGFAWRFGIVGFWVSVGIGIIWGFSQGRLDLRRWLRKQDA